MIVRGSRQLSELYDRLSPGDVYIGKIPGGPLRYTRLIDLMERGIHCLPTPLAQTLNASKAAQTAILNEWMLPLTQVIRRRADLIAAIGVYQRQGVGPVVTKEDRLHCGHGVRYWENIEVLYSISSQPDGVAHTAHLGGAAFGLLYWRFGTAVARFFDHVEDRQRERHVRRLNADEQRMDDLLAKISREGFGSLSRRERKFLNEQSRRRRDQRLGR